MNSNPAHRSVANCSPAPPPSEYLVYLERGKRLAITNALNWEVPLDEKGVAVSNSGWDLRKLLKDGRPTPIKLRTFSTFEKAAATMIKRGQLGFDEHHLQLPLPKQWQDFIKACVLNRLLIDGDTPGHVQSLVIAIRVIATVSRKAEPWLLDASDFQLAADIAKETQPSGEQAVLIVGFAKVIVDPEYLFCACPIYPLLQRHRRRYRAREKFLLQQDELRQNLSQRKAESKLPSRRAFWEIVRIVFTERPRTFVDAIRFSQLKVMLLQGLRVGEAALLPLDWRRENTYTTSAGTPAGEVGGISSALMLRHFAEKQGSPNQDSSCLYQETQYVPECFRETLIETLQFAEEITRPLRRTLMAQCKTGRILPMYNPTELVKFSDMYVHMTGVSVLTQIPEEIATPFLTRYAENYDISVLEEFLQVQLAGRFQPTQSIVQRMYQLQKQGLKFRDSAGAESVRRLNSLLRVGEVEEFMTRGAPTKLSDTSSLRLENGKTLPAWDILFLAPKRAIGEGRDGVPCHVGRYAFVGLSSPHQLHEVLGKPGGTNGTTLFESYGLTDEDRVLQLTPKSFRHLQNTELFRLGLADTIISKRFNRRSLVASYAYDHRSLEEDLERVTLPDGCEEILGNSKAAEVAKLIANGRANGPIVREFKRIQLEEGNEAAYTFLKVEADGFHSTPYGHCLNSFTVSPCPKHLECFAGCRHLSAANLPENRKNLLLLKARSEDVVQKASSMSTGSVGRDNQIHHAKVRLAGVEKLLATPDGEKPFPDGEDFSQRQKARSVLDGPSPQ